MFPRSCQQKGRPRWSLRLWLGLIPCFCAPMIFMQHAKVSTHLSSHQVEEAMESPLIRNSTSSPQLDNLISKYNLTLLEEQSAKIKIPDANRSIAFVHIGKTGGSTISKHIRNGCHRAYMAPCTSRKDGWTPNETAASYRIESYYHMENIPPEKLDHFTTIITAVRNPISRFLSAFAYAHPTNAMATNINLNMEEKQKYTCFPSISYLIKAGMGQAEIPYNKAHLQRMREKNGLTVSFGQSSRNSILNRKARGKVPLINCTELAQIAFGLNESWASVNASHPWLTHMSKDYRQYYQSMPPDKELIVLRSNHLWEDWVKVNHLLSFEYDAYKIWPSIPPFQEIQRNVSSRYQMKKRWKTQNSEEQLWLCQLLHEEIRTYLKIVIRAINLDKDDLLDAAADVDMLCGVDILGNANSTNE
mmetsp:Transcript_3400/g.7502  ORF Transcript_3400/g.7502 Transcript_3400/m.7502 type:complete len:417 (-) Transcript_3400:34-1284(-)